MTTTFRLRRPGDVDLVFDGRLLAETTSRTKNSQTHWTEVRVYATKSGKWVTETVGRTTKPGQVDRIKVLVHTDPDTVAGGLEREDVSAETGQLVRFLPNLARRCLEEAIEADPNLAGALVERI